MEPIDESFVRAAGMLAAIGTGVLCVAFGWFTYHDPRQSADAGTVSAETREQRRAGALAMALGAALFVVAALLAR